MNLNNGLSLTTFEAFLKTAAPRVRDVLARFRIPVEDAEELFGHSVLALLHQWDAVGDRERWLIRTLRRRCVAYWRMRRPRPLPVDLLPLIWLARPPGR